MCDTVVIAMNDLPCPTCGEKFKASIEMCSVNPEAEVQCGNCGIYNRAADWYADATRVDNNTKIIKEALTNLNERVGTLEEVARRLAKMQEHQTTIVDNLRAIVDILSNHNR